MISMEMVAIDYDWATHIGRREQNQDNLLALSASILPADRGGVFAVADGMGGHASGEFASRLACEDLQTYYQNKRETKNRIGPTDISRRLVEMIMRIDRHIRFLGLRDKEYEDMGTTLSCLVLTDTHSIIGHVGDSRIYRLRKGHLACLTVDHTFVQDMVFEGDLEPNDANGHPLRHLLTRVLGTGESLSLVDTRIDQLKKRDRFLLCTDGLHNSLSDQCISLLLSKTSPAGKTTESLINKALQNGARDNITAIVINT